MKFEMPFKEIYIHLPEGEPAFVCTIRYGGVLGTATRFPLVARAAPDLNFEEEDSSIVPVRRRLGPSATGI